MSLYTLQIDLPEAAAHLLDDEAARLWAERLAESGLSIGLARSGQHHAGPWQIHLTAEQDLDEAALIAFIQGIWAVQFPDTALNLTRAMITRQDVDPATDWRAETYRAFPAFTVGPYYIYGSHHTGGVPDGLMGLNIDAATAFGSGEHGTTKGCLMMMLDLKARGVCPWSVIDIGTGSGILGIAAWKLWKTPVLATDNDPEAVRVAAHHAALNDVPADATGMICALAEGCAAKIVQEKKPYELIIANILAGPLMTMAPDIRGCVDENGYVILSGILNEQATSVRTAYEAQGLRFRQQHQVGDWTTLLLQNAAI